MNKIFKKTIRIILTWEAKMVIKKYNPKVIAVIGSVGKTSTKDAIFNVLSKHKTVRKSEKSYNSEIGLLLTILGLPNAWKDPFFWSENIIRGFSMIIKRQSYPDVLILEIGVRKPGDIKKNILPWLKIDILVVTRFPEKPVHVEFFDNADKLIEEKSSLVKALKKNGLLILNQDDDRVYALHDKSKERAVSFGKNENSTYRILYPSYSREQISEVEVPLGINFRIQHKGNVFPVSLSRVLGLHNVVQATSAIACASEFGVDLLESIKNISDYKTPPGRLSLLEGINNSLIIDDTYNSSPAAAHEAVEVLKEFKGGRKIAILGDMLELGKYTEEEHLKLGEKVREAIDVLITVGPRARIIADVVKDKIAEENIFCFDKYEEVIPTIEQMIIEKDIVLVKGSQKMRLEKIIEKIMKDKENKKSLLCRQDKEWEER
jgi:UDP-N-acetylmuramoyl-tripeptide--D-alanyl-D-alanine ligase